MTLRIGFTYNLKDPATHGTDDHAEYETPETINAIETVLVSLGDVVRYDCVPGVAQTICSDPPDVMFNIAEGWGDRDRESFIPSLCQMLAIPFTGSDATALGVTMDKALTKTCARDAGVKTAEGIVCDSVPDGPPPFGFPAFVKPLWDGSSRGIDRHSLVDSIDELADRVALICGEYHQPALVEPYLDGRDFCVGLLGNGHPRILKTCEVILGHEDGIPFFSHEYKRHDTDVLDMNPDLPGTVIEEMEQAAVTLWKTLGLRDYSRFDFRTDSEGRPYLLEVNALPGLSPISGIFVRQAMASGITYEALIKKILERILPESV